MIVCAIYVSCQGLSGILIPCPFELRDKSILYGLAISGGSVSVSWNCMTLEPRIRIILILILPTNSQICAWCKHYAKPHLDPKSTWVSALDCLFFSVFLKFLQLCTDLFLPKNRRSVAPVETLKCRWCCKYAMSIPMQGRRFFWTKEATSVMILRLLSYGEWWFFRHPRAWRCLQAFLKLDL